MEFTAAYTIAPAHSTMTRSMAYSFATYYDADGHELDLPFRPDQTIRLARALQRGPVYCSLQAPQGSSRAERGYPVGVKEFFSAERCLHLTLDR